MNDLKILKRYFDNIGCFVCSHVGNSSAQIRYVSSAGGFWLTLCDEACKDVACKSKMSGVHISHLLDNDPTLATAFRMPIDFTAKRIGNDWDINYEHSSYPPEVGDFVAVPQEANFFRFQEDTLLNVYENQGQIVTITLDTGLKIIPIWYLGVDVEAFAGHLNGKEKIFSISLAELRSFAQNEGIKFVAVNFLTGDFDYAAIL